MKKLFLGASALIAAASFASAQTLPPPPAQGYVYTIPYHYAGYVGAGVSTMATAGDVMCVAGSASKTIRITEFGISAIATAATVIDAQVVLRSVANTGAGTAIAPVPLDSQQPAPTASITLYNTAPTPGAAIGIVRAAKLPVGTAGNSNTVGNILFTFAPTPVSLHGASQLACLNVSAAGAGAAIAVQVQYRETGVTIY